jgi:hypothetical protein
MPTLVSNFFLIVFFNQMMMLPAISWEEWVPTVIEKGS